MKDKDTKTLEKPIKKKAWNYGKRKPQADDMGYKWCSCIEPKLVSSFHGRGQASCLLCMHTYYH